MSLKAMVWVMEEAPTKDQGELAVLYALADRVDDTGKGGYPSQDWLALRARCSTRTVRRKLQALEAQGLIARGDQRMVAHFSADRRPVVWDICMDGRTNLPAGQSDRPDTSVQTAGQKRPNGRTPVSYKPSINHPEPSNQYLDHFGEFWNTFPRRVGKRKAEAAFIKACGRAPVEDILAGAQRLADDPNLPEKQFVPHPTTWLNRDGWDDDPLPARNTGPEARQNAPEHRYGKVPKTGYKTRQTSPQGRITPTGTQSSTWNHDPKPRKVPRNRSRSTRQVQTNTRQVPEPEPPDR